MKKELLKIFLLLIGFTILCSIGNCQISFSPVAGTYGTTQTVTITCSTPSSSIWYRIDGQAANPTDTLYTGPLTVSTGQTITASCAATGYTNANSQTANTNWKINAPGAPITFNGWTATSSGGTSGSVSNFNFIAGSPGVQTCSSINNIGTDSSCLWINTSTATCDSCTHLYHHEVFQDSTNATSASAGIDVSEFDAGQCCDNTTNALHLASVKCSANHGNVLEIDSQSFSEVTTIPCTIGIPVDVTVASHWTLGDTNCGGYGCMTFDWIKYNGTTYPFPAYCASGDTYCPNYPMTPQPTYTHFAANKQDQEYMKTTSAAGVSPVTTTRTITTDNVTVTESASSSASATYIIGSPSTTTTVTGTVVDSDAQPWIGGTLKLQFIPNPNQPNIGIYNINGVPLNPALLSYSTTLDNSGTFSISGVYDNTQVSPSGSTWAITVIPNASVLPTSLAPITISGNTQNVSNYINSNIKAPRFAAHGANAFGYIDKEATLNPVPGGSYFNVINIVCKQWTGTAFQNCNAGATATPYPPAFAIQAANSSVNGPIADPGITINTATHQIGVAGRTTLNTYTPEFYGAVHDAIILTDANCTAGSTTISTTTSTPFTSTAVDGGKTIVVTGCGQLSAVANSNGAGLIPTAFVSTIASVIDSQHAIMAAAPPSNTGTVTSITYVSGVTGVGSIGSTCTLTLPNGGTAALQMTGSNSFAPPAGLTSIQAKISTLDTGEAIPPTSATVTNGTATGCTGPAVITTTLAPSSWSNQWAAFGTNDRNAINSCIQSGTVASGTCHLLDGAQYMVSTPAAGQPNAGVATISINNTNGGIKHGLIDGKAQLIFAPTTPHTALQDDSLFYIYSTLSNCASGSYSLCPITSSPIPEGALSFTAEYSADVASLQRGQWLLLSDAYSAFGDLAYMDWVQVASVSGTTVNLIQPTRMNFPCAEAIVPGTTGCGFRVVSNLTQNVTLRDFEITIPNLQDPSGTGRSINAIGTTATMGLTLDKVKCSNASQSCFGGQFAYGTTLDNVDWKSELQVSELASFVNLTIRGSTFDKQASALNQNLSACAAGTTATGLDIDEGTGFYSITGNTIPQMCGTGIGGQFNHDGSISDNDIGWQQCQGSLCAYGSACINFVGGYRNSIHDNTCAGATSINGQAIVMANSGTPAITSAGNSMFNNKCNTANTTDYQAGCYRIPFGPTDFIQTPNGPTPQSIETNVRVVGANVASQSVFELWGLQSVPPSSPIVQDSIGTRYSNTGIFNAFNASPTQTGLDNWHQYYASFPSSVSTLDNTGFHFYYAPASSADAAFATFFPTQLFQIPYSGGPIFNSLIGSGTRCLQTGSNGAVSATSSTCASGIPIRAGIVQFVATNTPQVVTFTSAFSSGSPVCTLTPESDPTTAGGYWVTSPSTSGFTANITNSATIIFNYSCVINNSN